MGMLASMVMVLGSAMAVGQDPVEKKAFVLPHVLEAVVTAIDQPAPTGLSAADQKSYAAQTEWLKSVRSRLEPLAAKYDVTAPRDVATGQATGKRQHGSVVIMKEWGPLKATFEREGHQFDALSGVLKARHDIAMNAIRNLKG